MWGRVLVGLIIPAAGAVLVFYSIVFLLVASMCAYGDCGPNLLPWAIPSLALWLAGTGTWFSGAVTQTPGRLYVGIGLLIAAPTLGVVVLIAES